MPRHTITRVPESTRLTTSMPIRTSWEAPPTQVPQTVPETHAAANVAVEDNAIGDQYIWILSGADLRQPFGRQLPVDGADDALVQGFVRHTMAARPGICFEVHEVCLAVIIADFLRRRGTRAQQDESCYCDECDSHCGSTLLVRTSVPLRPLLGISPSKQNRCSFVHLIVELLILRTWAVR